ncbi:MAG: S8 family serine peptidase [Deltaproteobacteria bacterium]|nr:S8 family serine peptidase [Deltaproteobacteria bacterium]
MVALVAAGNSPRVVTALRVPRLPGKADVQLWRAMAPERALSPRALTPLFVRVSDPAAVATLGAAGFDVGLGRWQPLTFNAVQLSWAFATHGVELKSAAAHQPLLDVSLAEIGADRVQAGVGVQDSHRGKGVLVGIVDTGIDLTHPAFFDGSGKSRVVAVWDQDAGAGPAPKKFGYGRECQAKEIAGGGCPVGDQNGHGTHVAGIAAGSGVVHGVAPEASIAVVRSDRFTRIADAVLYLVELADDRDEPLVVNMSVGGQYGPHDGKTPLEAYLGELAGDGRILVAAAGNDGAGRIHAGAELSEVPVRVALDGVPSAAPIETLLDLWSEPSAVVELALELWHDGQVELSVPLSGADTDLLEARVDTGRGMLFAVSAGAELDPDHNRVHHTVVLDAEGGVGLDTGESLALRLWGRGAVDAWISVNDYRRGAPRFGLAQGGGWLSGDGERSIVVPATARDVITVGAYTVRTAWQPEGLERQSIAGASLGALAAYSSRGPTTDPSHTGGKPDLVAPGSVIASARAVSIAGGPMVIDAARVMMQGTSMSAPHVTGTIALMLEADPELSVSQARDQLRRTARLDVDVASLPDRARGAGKLDAAAAVATAENEAPSGCAAAPSVQGGLAVLLLVVARRRGRARR